MLLQRPHIRANFSLTEDFSTLFERLPFKRIKRPFGEYILQTKKSNSLHRIK